MIFLLFFINIYKKLIFLKRRKIGFVALPLGTLEDLLFVPPTFSPKKLIPPLFSWPLPRDMCPLFPVDVFRKSGCEFFRIPLICPVPTARYPPFDAVTADWRISCSLIMSPDNAEGGADPLRKLNHKKNIKSIKYRLYDLNG